MQRLHEIETAVDHELDIESALSDFTAEDLAFVVTQTNREDVLDGIHTIARQQAEAATEGTAEQCAYAAVAKYVLGKQYVYRHPPYDATDKSPAIEQSDMHIYKTLAQAGQNQ